MRSRAKSLACTLMALMLCTSITPTLAAEITTAGGDSGVDAILNAEASTFSVTVPTSLPIWVDSSGVLTVSTSAKIVNNSSGPVQVSGVEFIGKNGWSLASFDADLTTKKVGTKEVGFYLNGDTTDQQTLNFTQDNWAEISGGSEQPLEYNANIAPQSEALKEEIAEVIFTIGWSLSEKANDGPFRPDPSICKPFTLSVENKNTVGLEWHNNDLVIPATFVGEDGENYVITTIEDRAFNGVYNMTSVTIPDTVTYIGGLSFAYCTSMETVNMSNKVEFIGTGAFKGCTSLTDITLPNTLLNILPRAFSDCTALTNLVIPDSVNTIGDYAFDKVPQITYRGDVAGSPWGALSVVTK